MDTFNQVETAVHDAALKPLPRSPDLDCARAIAMILVLAGHALEISFNREAHLKDVNAFAIWQMIYAFHMPAFYFISGAAAQLSRTRTLRKVVIHSAVLISIAAITQILAASLNLYLSGYTSPFAAAKYVIYPAYRGTGYALLITWFLYSLALTQLSHALILYCRPAVKVFVLGFVVGGFVIAEAYGTYRYQLHTVAPGLLFYTLGWWFYPRIPGMGLIKLALLMLALAAYLTVAPHLNSGCALSFSHVCNSWNGFGFSVHLASGLYGNMVMFLVTALAGTTFVICAGMLVAKSAAARPISWIGKNTLSLLFINGTVLAFAVPRMDFELPLNEPSTWLIFAGLIIAQVLLIPLVRPAITKLEHVTSLAISKFLVENHL